MPKVAKEAAKTKSKSVNIRFEWFGEFINQSWVYVEGRDCPHCEDPKVWREELEWDSTVDENTCIWNHCLSCASMWKYIPILSVQPKVVGLLGNEMMDHMTFDELHRLQALKRAVSNLG